MKLKGLKQVKFFEFDISYLYYLIFFNNSTNVLFFKCFRDLGGS